MMKKRIFLLSVFLVGVWGQCCPPRQYEVTIDSFQVEHKNGAADRGMQHLSYDTVEKKMAVHSVSYTKNITSDIIMDYKEGKEYVLANGACLVFPLGNFSDPCIPEDANVLGQSYLGKPPKETPIHMFKYKTDNHEMYLTVTEDCIPIEAHFSNEVKGHSEFLLYSSFSTGIKDRSIFTPPIICDKQGISSPHVAGRRRRGLYFH